MTLDEAIKHCEEVVQDNINRANILWDSKEKARCKDCAEEHRQLAEWLKELKQLREQSKWIPVSERLPLLGSYKISDDVLITNGHEIDMGYLVERKGKIFWHYYCGEYEVCIKDEDNDATAWMPLPEPYKAESEDKDDKSGTI